MSGKARKFTVRGFTFKTTSNCRYAAVAVRERMFVDEAAEDRGEPATYVAFADIRKRSNNPETVRTVARRYGYHWTGTRIVAVDTTTGEEI